MTNLTKYNLTAVHILLEKDIKVYQTEFAISLNLNDDENTDFCRLSKFYLLAKQPKLLFFSLNIDQYKIFSYSN